MGSKLLPQALISLPSSLRLSQSLFPQKLGFSAELVSRRLSPISASFSSSSRVSSSQFGLVINTDGGRQRLSVVRAGEESEAEASENESPQEEAPPAEDGEPVTAEDSEAEAEPRPPRKPRVKMGEIMGILNQRAIEASESTRPVPDLRTGDIVEIKLEVPGNRRRLSTYKGIVISKQNAGIHTTIRIRRIIAGIGVEIVFPVYSPNIKEIKVMAHRKVRKARLYYLRDKLPRLSTFK